ncbi:alpha-ketoglutarate-dependent dioxygenase AlkB family protein [Salinispirillum marinum]|uniref:Alpha-ketoglutarate-dependent dioxygenase AlkB family protein n=2 Tax=Saccharospirillaceae TaxID=255527 RepID=A0ABV8B985_9GAMM
MVAQDPDVLYWPQYLTPEDADQLYEHCSGALAWRQETIRMFGRVVLQPRLQVWMGDMAYRYSGRTFEPTPWDEQLTALARRFQDELQVPFNSVLCNWYQSGAHSMGWHSDNEPELGNEPVIVSVSIGAARRFVLRQRSNHQQRLEYLLGHGDVLVMRGRTQQRWEHALPKTQKPVGARINLTYRYLLRSPQP